MREELKELHWETYEEVRQGFLLMLEPLRDKLDGSGHLHLGSHGAVYDEETSDMEAFSRLLWGIAPFLSQNQDEELKKAVVQSLIAGTNPQSEHYYGVLKDYDQKFVEMAAIATCFLLAKEATWDHFSAEEKENVANWLLQINQRKIPRNNWRFFRILVNIAMKKMGMTYAQEIIDQDFDLLESFYDGAGWYFDGKESQRDYYIPWAFHFYSLIYVKFMAKEEPERTGKMIERAILFAQDFQYFFDKNGVALPFGRSLTYRFAQSAFWSALVFANVEALPWPNIKGLFASNMRYWQQQEIFTENDTLSVGYHYQNLNMAEGYNAHGSSYWAFKNFLLLAVDRKHPFWSAQATFPEQKEKKLVKSQIRALIEQVDDTKQTLLYPAGQFINHQAHASAKYGKFVYSTLFGFSVPRGNEYYEEGAFDNVLAVSEGGHFYQAKGRDDDFELLEDRVIHYWQPLKGVQVKSTIIPLGNAHLRIHELDTERAIEAYDAGFSSTLTGAKEELHEQSAQIRTDVGTTLAQGIFGFDKAEIVRPEVNTNLLYKRSIMPVLKAKLTEGKHRLISLFAGFSEKDDHRLPSLALHENVLQIQGLNGEEILVNLLE